MIIKTIQWNIGGGKIRSANAPVEGPYDKDGMVHIVGLLRKYNPDIITLQETHADDKIVQAEIIATGENDTSTPPDHVQILFEALPGPKEYHIIKNAPHTFRDKEHLAEIKSLFLKWIDIFQK